LYKTSLIDVEHKIRDLLPYEIYQQDNQDFVEDYLEEVKPYHVQIKEFNLRYDGFDQFGGDLTDFDVPAYWDPELGTFISPILNGNEELNSSNADDNDPIWSTEPWAQWYNNYKLTFESVTIIDPGTGYTLPPVLTVVGDAVTPAVLEARIDSAGQIVAVDIISNGSGYTATPTITTGTNINPAWLIGLPTPIMTMEL
jgi:hypothetical protein